MPTRCLIVDDNEPFLEAARALLEGEGLSVAGVAATYAEALEHFESLRPDVVLIDVFLGEESGFELARQLAEDGDGHDAAATMIMISTHTEADLGDLIDASPAAGFVLKSELSADAIRSIVAATERRGR